VQLGIDKLRRAIDRYKEIGPALCGMHLGDIDMQIAQRIAVEGFLLTYRLS